MKNREITLKTRKERLEYLYHKIRTAASTCQIISGITLAVAGVGFLLSKLIGDSLSLQAFYFVLAGCLLVAVVFAAFLGGIDPGPLERSHNPGYTLGI